MSGKEKAEKSEVLKTASDGHDLVVICKSGCGELKRRRHRSDAQQWQRAHLAEAGHSKHEMEIVERKSEEKKPKSKAAKKAKHAPKIKAEKEAAA
jgi:hypothetical protein